MAKRTHREEEFELTASIERVEQSYYISQHRDIERPCDRSENPRADRPL